METSTKSSSKLVLKISEKDQENIRVMAAIHGVLLDDDAWIQLYPACVDFAASKCHSSSSSSDDRTDSSKVMSSNEESPPTDSKRIDVHPEPPVCQYLLKDAEMSPRGLICVQSYEGYQYEATGIDGVWLRRGIERSDSQYKVRVTDTSGISQRPAGTVPGLSTSAYLPPECLSGGLGDTTECVAPTTNTWTSPLESNRIRVGIKDHLQSGYMVATNSLIQHGQGFGSSTSSEDPTPAVKSHKRRADNDNNNLTAPMIKRAMNNE